MPRRRFCGEPLGAVSTHAKRWASSEVFRYMLTTLALELLGNRCDALDILGAKYKSLVTRSFGSPGDVLILADELR